MQEHNITIETHFMYAPEEDLTNPITQNQEMPSTITEYLHNKLFAFHQMELNQAG